MTKLKPQKFDCRRARGFNKNGIDFLSSVNVNSPHPIQGPIVYWMSRDQRVKDNWALIAAQDLALDAKQPLIVCFYLSKDFLGATLRQYDFMLRGLSEVEKELESKNIIMRVLDGEVAESISGFLKNVNAGMLIADFSPLNIYTDWKKNVGKSIDIPALEVDAHNIVPAWLASPKQEFSARTFRPKLKKLLPEFLTEFPIIKKHPYSVSTISYGKFFKNNEIDWVALLNTLKVDRLVLPVSWVKPGEKNAQKMLKKFLEEKFALYDQKRNDPSELFQSDISPYLHFGQLSPQRVSLDALAFRGIPVSAKESFLDEVIVRRELADNFCLYNRRYDSCEGFPNWAQKTLDLHTKDERPYIYLKGQLEAGKTHDELWNAAQLQMVSTGKMHGYMRMYWAKKLLEWSKTPAEALKIAIFLNDKYELDGRDPNGYAGIAWSIGGVHDRPWFNRPIFGLIRYMSFNGLKSKFNIKKYIQQFATYPSTEKHT